jgi:hypothetical protein
MTFLNQADGSGKIDIGGKTWPVSYQVIAADGRDGAKNIHIELSVPRDWLLERGFKSEARLVRENGTEIDMRSPDAVGTDDPIAIRLRSDATSLSEEEARDEFPELTTH